MDSDCTAHTNKEKRRELHSTCIFYNSNGISDLRAHEGQDFYKTHHHLKITVIHLTLFLALLPATVASGHTRRLHFVISIVVVFIIFIA